VKMLLLSFDKKPPTGITRVRTCIILTKKKSCITIKSATFLPEVAQQQGWTQNETIAQLVRKAGYHGELTADLLAAIHCTRYQSSKHRLTYDAYIEIIGKDPLRGNANADEKSKQKNWHQFFHR